MVTISEDMAIGSHFTMLCQLEVSLLPLYIKHRRLPMDYSKFSLEIL